MIIVKETLDVFVEEICEEEVEPEFPNTYTIRGEPTATPNDTSRLLDEKPDTFRYFLFRHLR